MTTDPAQTGAYLSDDAETRMRLAMPRPCRACKHLIIRHSFILDGVLKSCEATGENEVLARVLLRLAESGRCDEADPFLPPEAVDEEIPRMAAGLMPILKEPVATTQTGATPLTSNQDRVVVAPTPLSSAIDLFVSGLQGGKRP